MEPQRNAREESLRGQAMDNSTSRNGGVMLPKAACDWTVFMWSLHTFWRIPCAYLFSPHRLSVAWDEGLSAFGWTFFHQAEVIVTLGFLRTAKCLRIIP